MYKRQIKQFLTRGSVIRIRLVLEHLQFAQFLNGITELMQELVARYQGISEEKKEQFQGKAKGEVIGKCPRCGADVREGKVNFYCSDRNCAFTFWKNDKFLASQGKKMDKAAAKKFLGVKPIIK